MVRSSQYLLDIHQRVGGLLIIDPPKGTFLWSTSGCTMEPVFLCIAWNFILEIHPGMLALVLWGTVESSFVKALFCILEYDSSRGYIEIDGIKTCDIGLHKLWPRISIVSQEPLVFTNTIWYNMDHSLEASEVEMFGRLWKLLI